MTGRDQCPIGYKVQRKCPKCRLDRCFAMGMRKDFLQTVEQKQKRQRSLEANRSIASSQRLLTSVSPQSSSPPVQTQTTSDIESLSPVLNDIDNVCPYQISFKSIDFPF